MALALFDRVQETTTTTGTGSLTLAGAVPGFQSFAVVGNTNTCYYTIVDGIAWEVGIGTYSTSGPTLARTTVLSNSNADTSPITLASGSKQVFLTYPAEKSVNLDSSGNVSPLGTVASGTWQGTTVGVAYGGTGVTTSSGVNSVVLRDSNGNIAANNMFSGFTVAATTGGTTVLTVASTSYQRFTGTLTQTIQLPDATTLVRGFIFVVENASTQNLTITNAASATVDTVYPGGAANYILISNSTVAGTWTAYGLVPSEVDWGTDTLRLSNTVVTGGFWQGGTVVPAYGGTGLTTFVGANNALYSTGALTLTAGTLPVLAGGTGATTSTGSGAVVLATSPTLVTPLLGTPTSGDFSTGTFTWPTFNQNTTGTAANITATTNATLTTLSSLSLPGSQVSGNISGNAANVTGTVAIANGGTGATTEATARTSLGATTLGSNLFTITNVAAIAFPQFNADNTVSSLDAATFRTAIGAGTSSTTGTVTSVATAGTVSGITLTGGPITSTGTVTLGGTLAVTASNFASQTANTFLAAPNGVAGVPAFRAVAAADIPTLNQNTTGSSGSCTGNAATATLATTATTANALATANNYQVNSLGVGTAASGTAGEIRATNNITAYYSDARLKTKIGDITDPLGKVRRIETMVYHANEVAVALGYDASVIEVGVTAQSVLAVQPEAVAPAPIDEKYMTVRYERLVPLLLAAVTALEDRLMAAEAELAKLRR